jgi:hypothetical protein
MIPMSIHSMTITKNKIIIMEILQEAEVFEKTKMSNMSNSDRVTASREAKRLVLAINKIYMNTKEATLMDVMKRLTEEKNRYSIERKT